MENDAPKATSEISDIGSLPIPKDWCHCFLWWLPDGTAKAVRCPMHLHETTITIKEAQ